MVWHELGLWESNVGNLTVVCLLQLGHLHKKRLLFHNRFPCHLLGPDVDQPLEKSLADIDPQSCKVHFDSLYVEAAFACGDQSSA